nr:ATP-dependent metallopeptidase FtsH/Yme1/Tma family protein [Mycobacterium tuberculosis]
MVLLGWSFFYFSDDTRGYKPVDTSVAITQINGDNVKSAQIDDREQQPAPGSGVIAWLLLGPFCGPHCRQARGLRSPRG